jgi:hypothetical protein
VGTQARAIENTNWWASGCEVIRNETYEKGSDETGGIAWLIVINAFVAECRETQSSLLIKEGAFAHELVWTEVRNRQGPIDPLM